MNLRRYWRCAALALVASLAAGQEGGEFYVVTLGTGVPIPNVARACAATLVVAGETSILIDTGRAFLPRLTAAGFQDVSMVLYTHFHSDHVAELGELMVNRGIAGASAPLPVYGPAGTRAVVEGLLAGYRRDTEYRIAHHGEKWHVDAMTANVTECAPGIIYEKDGLAIRMFDVDHEPVRPAVGYRVDFRGRSVVVSGDTKKTAAMVEMARGCDILVHEAMSAPMLEAVRPGLQRTNPRQAAMLEEMMSHHTTAVEAAEIARDAGVKKLVLTHLVPSIPPTEAAEQTFVNGMAAVFSGETIVARDGMVIRP